MEQVMGDIHEIISSLYEISLTIRNAAPRDRLLKAAAIDVSHFQKWDRMHIEHKFPKANPVLIERLAQANCRRRQHFKYLEKHHYKLALGLDTYLPQEKAPKLSEDKKKYGFDKTIVEIGPRSVASSMPATAVTKNTQTTVATFREIEKDPDTEEALSETSSAASEGTSDGRELPIPAPPKGALGGEPFECPYCFEIMRISSVLTWR